MIFCSLVSDDTLLASAFSTLEIGVGFQPEPIEIQDLDAEGRRILDMLSVFSVDQMGSAVFFFVEILFARDLSEFFAVLTKKNIPNDGKNSK